jgi:RES domain-containing protein
VDIPAFPPARPAPAPARWHRAGDPWPLYATLEPGTAWAEWQAATGGAIDPADERRRLWTLDVDRLPVVDLRDAVTRTALGVKPGDLDDGWGAPQELVTRLRATGAHGVVVPSAARPGHWNLVVFPDGFARVAVRAGRAMHPAPPDDQPRRREISAP